MASSLTHRLRAEIARLEYRIAVEGRRPVPDNLDLSELKRRRLLLKDQLSDREASLFDHWRPLPAHIGSAGIGKEPAR